MAANNPNPQSPFPDSLGSINFPISTWRQVRLVLVLTHNQAARTAWLKEQLNRFDLPVVWLSLNHGDNTVVLFYTHLACGLHSTFPGAGLFPPWEWGEAAPDDVETWMIGLINGCAALSDDFFLVLDGYQVIEQAPIHQALALLLDYLPPQMTVILMTSVEPDLPLAHLRVRSQMVEIRL